MKLIKVCISLFFLIVTNTYAQHIGQGVTSPDDWRDYSNLGIYVDVDTSGCGFESTPHYLVSIESLEELGYHWGLTGLPAIYRPTPTGFRVYLRWADHPSEEPTIGSLAFANPLRTSTAIDRQWVIRWTGIEQKDCPSRQTLKWKEIESENLKIYPNPGHDKISIASEEKVSVYEIYDLNANIVKISNKDTIDIAELPNGKYIVKAFTKKGIITKKFIKE
ncbi:T9SS type A sorting domain-containing protein [Aquimarina rhabdastrellae]